MTTTTAPTTELFAGNLFTWHVTTEELALAHVVAHRGGEPALHIHEREDETYVVLEGELTFKRGDELIEAGPGDVVFLPRGVEHGFALHGDHARLLLVATPGGLEIPFHALSQPLADDAEVPPMTDGPPPPEAIAAMAAAFGAFGVEFTGPPLAG